MATATKALDYQADIETAVYEAYLREPKALTIKEVAELVEFSESTVRKYIYDCSELRWTKVEINLHSTDYPMYTVGTRMVDAVYPERRMLRREILALREALNSKEQGR